MKRNKLITIILCSFLVLLVFLVKSKSIIEIDNRILELLSSIRNNGITKFLEIYTDFIVYEMILVILIILLSIRFNYIIKIALIINSIGVGILNIGIKTLFKVSRPLTFMIIKADGYSFPSGHSVVAASFYLLIMYIVYKNIDKKYLKYSIIIFLLIIILSVGFSRMYLGVHYLSDVLASYLIGLLISLFEIRFIREWKYGKSIRSKKG